VAIVGVVIVVAATCYFYAFIGRSVARRFPNLNDDSIFDGVKPTGRFQVYRQRAIVRQGPKFQAAGHAAMAIALLGLLVVMIYRII
jgi:hypothetical protein